MASSTEPDIVIDELPPQHRSLRIAVVTESYPPEVNGVALTVARIVQGLRDRRHDIQLVRPRQRSADAGLPPDAVEQVLLRGMPVPRYPQLRMGVPSTRVLFKLWSLRRPDVVHIATEGPLGWSAMRAAERLRVPVVTDFRTNFQSYTRYYGIGWLRKPVAAYLRKFHNRALATTVPTQSLRDELVEAGFKHLQVIPRGVDAQHFHPERRDGSLRAAWGADAQTTIAMCVSRLAPEKNLPLAIEAVESQRRAGANVRMVVVGDGPLRQSLSAQYPHVHFVGQKTGVELTAHYASADLFVFASLTETFGNVTLEAMASQLAVVAYRHAAAAHLIKHRHNGWLAEPGDTHGFARCVQEALVSPSARARCAEAARTLATTFDWALVVQQVENVLARAARTNAPIDLPQRRGLRPLAG